MEGDWQDGVAKILGGISIHSLRMEGDCATVSSQYTVGNFNPLPPYGGRRFQLDGDGNEYGISIHSLRMEGDLRHRPTPLVYLISIHSLRMEGDLCLAATGGNQ